MEKPLLDLENTVYHENNQRIGSTGLRFMRRSPAHYYANFLAPDKVIKPPTPAMLLGAYTHCALLEPERFDRQYTYIDDSAKCTELKNKGLTNPKTSKEYRQWFDEAKQTASGKEIIPFEDWQTVTSIRNSVMSMPHVAKYLNDVIAEKTIFFTETTTGALCKAKPDGIRTGLIDRPVIIELKTCENAAPQPFGRQALQYGYHCQAALYVDALVSTHISDNPPLHLFLAVEKEPPFAAAIYFTPDEVLELGRSENTASLKRYVECMKTGKWSGYSELVEPLQLPAYAFRQ